VNRATSIGDDVDPVHGVEREPGRHSGTQQQDHPSSRLHGTRRRRDELPVEGGGGGAPDRQCVTHRVGGEEDRLVLSGRKRRRSNIWSRGSTPRSASS
jgi:hypothetical protein